MGIISETAASIEAAKLKKVLKYGLRESKEVKHFLKKHILPLYEDAIAEAWEELDQKLMKSYDYGALEKQPNGQGDPFDRDNY